MNELKFDLTYVLENTVLKENEAVGSFLEWQREVSIDQVLIYFQDKIIPLEEESLALKYALMMCDELCRVLFNENSTDMKKERLEFIKNIIQVRWGLSNTAPMGNISHAFERKQGGCI
jgi:hypothetical protein